MIELNFIGMVLRLQILEINNPSQNEDMGVNAGQLHALGRRSNANDRYFHGYMAEVNFVDGSAKSPTDFGRTDDNGVWVPKAYAGSYGTNGFYLDFAIHQT